MHTKVIDRDFLREKAFKDVYGLKSKIATTTVHDGNWDWIRVVLDFTDARGKVHRLTEHFNDGTDNTTKFVELESDGVKKIFDKFIDAELAMVELIKGQNNG